MRERLILPKKEQDNLVLYLVKRGWSDRLIQKALNTDIEIEIEQKSQSLMDDQDDMGFSDRRIFSKLRKLNTPQINTLREFPKIKPFDDPDDIKVRDIFIKYEPVKVIRQWRRMCKRCDEFFLGDYWASVCPNCEKPYYKKRRGKQNGQ